MHPLFPDQKIIAARCAKAEHVPVPAKFDALARNEADQHGWWIAAFQGEAANEKACVGRTGSKAVPPRHAVALALAHSFAGRGSLPGGVRVAACGEYRLDRLRAEKCACNRSADHDRVAVPARRSVPVGQLGDHIDRIAWMDFAATDIMGGENGEQVRRVHRLHHARREFARLLVGCRLGIDHRTKRAGALQPPGRRCAIGIVHASSKAMGRPLMPQTPGNGRQPGSSVSRGSFICCAMR